NKEEKKDTGVSRPLVPETSTYSKGILRKCKRCKLSQIDRIDICQQW
ncbi:9377_t:CDS:1, partial [Dentiscutata heterogama]